MQFSHILKDFLFIILGIFSFTYLGLVLITSLPVILYRLIICTVLKLCYPKKILQPVNLTGAFFSTEFHKSYSHLPPRTALVINTVIEGQIDAGTLISSLDSKWIKAKTSQGHLKYPELQQYVEGLMGFMFWKKDKNFSLANHIFFHKIENSKSISQSKEFEDKLMEDLLNKPFVPGRSPWELHVVHNYMSKEDSKTNKYSTLMISRWHHCIVDGFSILNLYAEGIWETTSEQLNGPKEAKNVANKINHSLKGIIGRLISPLKLLRDSGCILSQIFLNSRSPFYISDSNKSGKHVIGSSSQIPLQKVKMISKKFGVSFSSVIITAISRASGKLMKWKEGCSKEIPKISIGTVLPLPNHPDKLTNHATGVVMQIKLDPIRDPIEGLEKCNRDLTAAMQSIIPSLTPLVAKMFALNFAFICRQLLYYRNSTVVLSSFRISTKPVYCQGSTILTASAAVGCCTGVAGLVFTVIGYHDHLRLLAIAENALLSKEEVQQLIEFTTQEIDCMYNVALESDKNPIKLAFQVNNNKVAM